MLIVDEFTGRTMPGRRWSEVCIRPSKLEGVRSKGDANDGDDHDSELSAHDKLAGMTGTAETEETEFFQIYKLEVAVIGRTCPWSEDRHDLGRQDRARSTTRSSRKRGVSTTSAIRS